MKKTTTKHGRGDVKAASNVVAFPNINTNKRLGDLSGIIDDANGFDLREFLMQGITNDLHVRPHDNGIAFIDASTGRLVWLLVDCKLPR